MACPLSEKSWPFVACVLALAAGALVFRTVGLERRPMHTDEATQAVKVGKLLETGRYAYDPHDYHGPVLPYLTVPSMWLAGIWKFADATEFSLRVVPALFGAGIILLLLLVATSPAQATESARSLGEGGAKGIGRAEVLVAGALTAISPAMVFYSRYYIHEIPLVFFTLGAIAAGWRYTRTKATGWALLAGAFLGLMHATKETCVIAWFAAAAGIALTVGWSRWIDRAEIPARTLAGSPAAGRNVPVRAYLKPKVLALAAAVGLAISFVLFSSFFTDMRGPVDSVLTYLVYLGRGAGGGLHDHPWHYYLGMLAYARYGPGPWWSEGLILLLALAGAAAALAPEGFTIRGREPLGRTNVALARFLAFYTLIMTVVYAAIPYKTPWCMLGFLHGMILLAGVGAVAIVRCMPNVPAKAVVALALAAGGLHLARQAERASLDRRFHCSPRNPYVYAHTLVGHVKMMERIGEIGEIAPEGHDMLVVVVAPEDGQWPHPWYLRRFRHVGYWPKVGDLPEGISPAAVVASAEFYPELSRKLPGEYSLPSHGGLRPAVLQMLQIRRDLWDEFMKPRGGAPGAGRSPTKEAGEQVR
ncbi:MAG: flippase activity-associated protein Agl23 [Planctomycetota bacterium]|jgi:uncharacterized protein (TIGR03663 family)